MKSRCKFCLKDIQNNNKTYCNTICRNKNQSINPTHGKPSKTEGKCLICGALFIYNLSMRPNAVACSKACRSIWHGQQATGKLFKYGNYSCVQTFRQMARKIFLPECAICGWNDASCDVCHIIASKNGGEDTFDNVVLLCPNHHRVYDAGKIHMKEIVAARKRILK